MPLPDTIFTYMTHHSRELGERILRDFPALHRMGDPLSPRIEALRRKPFPAQSIAIMGIVKRWEDWRTAAIVGEMGTGKTLMAFGAIDVHSNGRRYNALAMVPPHLVEKTAREAFQTFPRIRVFMIDDLRNGGDPAAPHGINEVKLRKGEVVREGLHTSLSDLRQKKDYFSSRKRWESLCPESCLFIVSRERMKLSYFWRDAYRRKVQQGVQVVICHPKLVETGLDLLDFPTIIFYESGYSLHTLRQASRRSWRIGQYRPVRVKFFCYESTMQTRCLRLMGKKLLTALMLEGKFYGEGLQDIGRVS